MWIEWYQYENKRICKYWLQRENCIKCLFENLCTPEEKKQDQNKWTSKNKESD